MRLTTLAAAVAAALAVATPALAADAAKPEEILKMRQGLFQAVKANFGPLVAIAKGEAQPGDKTVQQAENLAALARIVPMSFGPGSEALPNARTKPEAFTNADFAKGAQMFQAETAKLAEAAKAGGDAIKAQVGAVGKTCKTCHDTFRNE